MSRLKREFVEKYQNSALTVPEFCKREGINVHTFRSWLY
jgi:transposase-like protein